MNKIKQILFYTQTTPKNNAAKQRRRKTTPQNNAAKQRRHAIIMEQILIFIIVVFSLFSAAFCMINPICFCCCCVACCNCFEGCCLIIQDNIQVFIEKMAYSTKDNTQDLPQGVEQPPANIRTVEIKPEQIEEGFELVDQV